MGTNSPRSANKISLCVAGFSLLGKYLHMCNLVSYFHSGVDTAGVLLWVLKVTRTWMATGGPGEIGAHAILPAGEG